MISACALLFVAASQHIGSEGEYQDFHPSLGAVCEHESYGSFSAGYFKNSQDDDTIWLAKRKYTEFAKSNRGQSFYEYGVVAGYSDYPVLPLARAGYDFSPFKHVGTELFVMPGVETVKGKTHLFMVVAIQLKLR